METNKITYIHNNLVNSTPTHRQIVDSQDDLLWKRPTDPNAENDYKTIISNVSIGKECAPEATLDVSGSVNVSTQYTINYVSIAPPIGSVMAYTVANSPDGWLICDGSEISRSEYAGLFAVIGTTFGSGDGRNTFKLPNYQGAFLRGTGTNGLYSGPAVNTPQAHATQTHTHPAATTISDPGHVHTQSHKHNAIVNDPGHFHTLSSYEANGEEGTRTPSFNKTGSMSSVNNIVNATNTGITVELSTDTTSVHKGFTGITAATTVGASTINSDLYETRPYNYGVYWIIKY